MSDARAKQPGCRASPRGGARVRQRSASDQAARARHSLMLASALLMAVMLLVSSCVPRLRSQASAPPSPAAASPPVRTAMSFTDVAQQAGIRFTLGHSGRSPLNILETAGHGCAFLDVDGDGWLDILLVGQPRCALYRNLGA